MHKVIAAAIDSNIISASESFIDQCCAQNVDYARTYDEKIYGIRAPPSKHLAVVCCMDARLDVFRMLGLKPGEAHIIRNGKQIEYLIH
jgi:carbonic anhydrase